MWVCFDRSLWGVLRPEDGVNIMKGYMESGEFSRGKESIRADGSIVLGNFDVDVEHHMIGHLFGPLPPEMRNDTAFMDRILLISLGGMSGDVKDFTYRPLWFSP